MKSFANFKLNLIAFLDHETLINKKCHHDLHSPFHCISNFGYNSPCLNVSGSLIKRNCVISGSAFEMKSQHASMQNCFYVYCGRMLWKDGRFTFTTNNPLHTHTDTNTLSSYILIPLLICVKVKLITTSPRSY